jgi:DNA-binding transcriptional MocR family regulator
MTQRDPSHTANLRRAIEDLSDAIDRSAVNPRSMLPAFLQLAFLLRGMIIARQMPPGAPLPSEPEIQTRFDVSRDTVRHAVQFLREVGLVETRRGVGHFVIMTPKVREVVLAPGSRVAVRMPTPDEQSELLGLVVYVVTEPGKVPRVYDPATTVLAAPE